MALTAYTLCTIHARQATTLAFSEPVSTIDVGNKQNYTSGTGLFQVDLVYCYSGSLAALATTIFNMKDGVLNDNFGNPVAFSTLKVFCFQNLSTKTIGYCSLMTYGTALSNFLYNLWWPTPAPLLIYSSSQFFVSCPSQGYSCGTYLKIKAYDATASYRLFAMGIKL